MERTREEHQKAYGQFKEVNERYRAALKEWEAERLKGSLKSNDNLLKGFKMKETESTKKVDDFVQAKMKEFQSLGKVTVP